MFRAVVLATLLSPILAGCIVAEPAPYEAPDRTPPILDLAQTLPWIGAPIAVDHRDDPNPDEPTKIEFRIPLRSEDGGEHIWFALHVDYKLVSNRDSKTDIHNKLYPSTFDDDTRSIVRTWEVDASPGCHQLTMIMAHESSWDLDRYEPFPLPGAGDSAIVSWWINVNPAPGERYTLRNCPSQGDLVER